MKGIPMPAGARSFDSINGVGGDGKIVRTKYENGTTALIVRWEDDPSFAKLTLNPEGAPLPEGIVAIKDYSENEGVYAALLSAGIIAPAHHWLKQGHVQIPICKLLMEIPEK